MFCYSFCSKITSAKAVLTGCFGEQGITVVEQGKMYGNIQQGVITGCGWPPVQPVYTGVSGY